MFFDTGVMPRGWNSTAITLIPMVAAPISIRDYRPIWVVHSCDRDLFAGGGSRFAGVRQRGSLKACFDGCDVHYRMNSLEMGTKMNDIWEQYAQYDLSMKFLQCTLAREKLKSNKVSYCGSIKTD